MKAIPTLLTGVYHPDLENPELERLLLLLIELRPDIDDERELEDIAERRLLATEAAAAALRLLAASSAALALRALDLALERAEIALLIAAPAFDLAPR